MKPFLSMIIVALTSLAFAANDDLRIDIFKIKYGNSVSRLSLSGSLPKTFIVDSNEKTIQITVNNKAFDFKDIKTSRNIVSAIEGENRFSYSLKSGKFKFKAKCHGELTISNTFDITVDNGETKASSSFEAGKYSFNMNRKQMEKKPKIGVALTFDDNFIKSWHSAAEMFKKHGAKVTFYVTKFHLLSDEEVEMIRELQEAGHEIGSHGYDHKNVLGDYNGDPLLVNKYIDEEITPLQEAMKDAGLTPPKVFAYPNGSRNEYFDKALLNVFQSVRGINSFKHSYTDCKKVSLLYAASIDKKAGVSLQSIKARIDIAIEEKEVLLLYAHKIVEEENGIYQVSLNKLEEIISYVKSVGGECYTVAELN